MNRKIYLSLAAVALFFLADSASAANFSITLDKDTFSVGDTFSATIRVDTEGVGVNAGQATIIYPVDVLEVQSVDKTSSVFNFWLEEPNFDNIAGRISFIGGSISGLNARSLQVLKINFRIKGTGDANISFTDTVITASDGSGTSVLTTVKGVSLLVSGIAENIRIQSTETPPPPIQIERPAVSARNVPEKPTVQIPLYPNQEVWSNISSNFIARWDLPADVSGVATEVNKQPTFLPTVSEGLFDNKTFKGLEDGIWYLHVRFRNNVGWGSAEHYKISIDTAPPSQFEVRVDEGVTTDFPRPTLRFNTSDQPSGIDYYTVSVDRGEKMKTEEESFTLPTQFPGSHKFIVEAHDKAGNITESKIIDLEILPISSPSINAIPKETYTGEGALQLSGNSLPNVKIEIGINNLKGEKISRGDGQASESGIWNVSVGAILTTGKYVAEVVAIDSRGARSLPVFSDEINLRQRPLFVLAGLEITAVALVVMLVIILILGFLAGWFFKKANKERRSNLAVIAHRDISTVFGLLEKDVEKMLRSYDDGKIDPEEEKEIEYYLKRMKENMSKMKVYLKQNVDEIKE